MAEKKQLLFVDTNIWLDFYRPRQSSDVSLPLLRRLEKIKEKIIVTHVLEMEYKKNRQAVILDALNKLQSPQVPLPLGFLSEAKASKAIATNHEAIKKRIKDLQKRLQRALTDPLHHDPVYQSFQRICKGTDAKIYLSVSSDRRLKRVIRERAVRRFFLGCPPRKPNDTSIGDAINWEWMVQCAKRDKAELVILTRDNDYGPQFEKHVLLNDHLKQEFKDRVSKQRTVRVYNSAGLALKHFHVAVPEKLLKGEFEFIRKMPSGVAESGVGGDASRELLAKLFREWRDIDLNRSDLDDFFNLGDVGELTDTGESDEVDVLNAPEQPDDLPDPAWLDEPEELDEPDDLSDPKPDEPDDLPDSNWLDDPQEPDKPDERGKP